MKTTILIFLLSSCTLGQVLPKAGDYLSRDYVRTLKATISPKLAQKCEFPLGVELRKQADSTLEVMIHNFHEGMTIARIHPSGRIESFYGSDDIIILSRTSIKARSKIFDFVKNSQKWIQSHLLKGEYRDGTSKKYVFSDSLFLEPNHPAVLYSIGLDLIGPTDFDYLDMKDSCYAFRMTKDVLFIWETVDEGDGFRQIAKTPKWVLTRFNTMGAP